MTVNTGTVWSWFPAAGVQLATGAEIMDELFAGS